MKKYINYIIVIGFVIFFYFCFLKFYYPKNDLPKLYKLPNFTFLMFDDTSYTEKDMEDNISVVNFFYTSCPAICPTMMSQMNLLYEQIDNEKVKFVSFNVDPMVDSKDRIKEFSDQLGISGKDRWDLVMTSSDEIASLCEKGFKFNADNLPYDHPMKLILVDKDLMIRGYYDYQDTIQMNKIIDDIGQIIGGN